jgi:hypothetical protein
VWLRKLPGMIIVGVQRHWFDIYFRRLQSEKVPGCESIAHIVISASMEMTSVGFCKTFYAGTNIELLSYETIKKVTSRTDPTILARCGTSSFFPKC